MRNKSPIEETVREQRCYTYNLIMSSIKVPGRSGSVWAASAITGFLERQAHNAGLEELVGFQKLL